MADATERDVSSTREWGIRLVVPAELVEDIHTQSKLKDCRDDLVGGGVHGHEETFGELDFLRVSADPEEAIRDVIAALTAAYGEDAVVAVDPQLVDISGIASDLGVTREAVRHWADRRRGPGNFPYPLGIIGKGQRAWRWYDVLEWVRRNGLGDVEGDHPIPTHVVLKVDAEIQARRAAKQTEAAA